MLIGNAAVPDELLRKLSNEPLKDAVYVEHEPRRLDPTGSASSQLKRFPKKVGVVKLIKCASPPTPTHAHTTLPFDNRGIIKGDVADQRKVSDHLFCASFFFDSVELK